MKNLAIEEVEVIDHDDVDLLLYPTLREDEEKRKLIKSDIIPLGKRDMLYFPLNFRMSALAIESIAKKYNRRYDYPEADSDDERYLIGPEACSRGRDMDCPYLKKAFAVLQDEKDAKDLVALYLLDADQGEMNDQYFLALTRTGVLFRSGSSTLQRAPYEDLRFAEDGIESRRRVKEFKGNLLDYGFDEAFLSFVHEFLQLRRTKLLPVRETHPFAHHAPELKRAYLDFLVDAAAAEGGLTAHKLIWLEQLAREFCIPAKTVELFLKKALKGGVKGNKLQSALRTALAKMDVEYHYVFVEDTITATIDERGECSREQLLKLLSKDDFCRLGYVESYRRYVCLQKQADEAFRSTLEQVKYSVSLKNIYRRRMYHDALRLQIIDMTAHP